LTIGGDKLEYDNESASLAASLLETKIIVKSTISDAKHVACFLGMDIENFFLETPMKKLTKMVTHIEKSSSACMD